MTNLEYGLKNHLIKWEVNELFGNVAIVINDCYPKTNEDIEKVLKYLLEERK